MPDSLALLYPDAVRRDWFDADCLGPVDGDGDRLSRSLAYCKAAWAAETGYDGFAGGGGAGRDAVAALGVRSVFEEAALEEVVFDEAVFVRLGGGTGGGGLVRMGMAGAWGLSVFTGSVWLRETEGDGSRSINVSVLAVDDRRGGTGGTGFRRSGGAPVPVGVSLASPTPDVVRSADGFEGFVGGTRFAGFAVTSVGVCSSSSRKSIKSPLSMLFTSSAGLGVSRGRRGGNAGLLDRESD